ncbi:ribonuclease H-like domain-containing protein [Tanacetum coccineum]
MDLETAQTTTTAKLPILKQGEYDMWRLRIEQYFQVQDYALWDVIENGNSFKPAAQTTTNADGTSTSLIPGPVTTEEKVQKKNDVKARSMLLMALPNEHLMTFNQYKDAKTLFAAIQTRFGGNEATKKTQKTLLKQMYENFSAPSIESLDSIFNRLQKIVSQLAILDVEQEVKRTASSSLSSQNMAFVSSPSSTNEVNTAYGVSTANTQISPASTQVSTASTQVSTTNLSDATIYAFLVNQLNGSQLVHEDLEQIHEDYLKEMDLKWQLALLSMRTRKGPRNQNSRNRNQDSSRRIVNVEETSSKAMVAIDGAGFDWSFIVDDEVPTNMALMAFSDSEAIEDSNKSLSFEGYGLRLVRIVSEDTSNEVMVISDVPMPKAVNTARPISAVVNVVKENHVNVVKGTCPISQTLRNLIEDILPLEEEQKEEKLLVKELLKVMCDNKNNVLFTDIGCFVLSSNFKLADESQATLDESMLWHRRLGHVNFKTINKLVKENLARGLPTKRFENDQTCVACLKGKQHKASFKDDYSRFTWIFFLASKDETSGILKSFITEIENLVDKKVKKSNETMEQSFQK